MPGTLPNLNNRSCNHNPVHHSHACYVTRSFNEYHRGCYFEAPTWNCSKFVPQDLEQPSKQRGNAIKYTYLSCQFLLSYFWHLPIGSTELLGHIICLVLGRGSRKMTRISENPSTDITVVLSKKLYSIVFSCFCHTGSRFLRRTLIFWTCR